MSRLREYTLVNAVNIPRIVARVACDSGRASGESTARVFAESPPTTINNPRTLTARFIFQNPTFLVSLTNRSSERIASSHGSTVTISRKNVERSSYALSSHTKAESLSPNPV